MNGREHYLKAEENLAMVDTLTGAEGISPAQAHTWLTSAHVHAQLAAVAFQVDLAADQLAGDTDRRSAWHDDIVNRKDPES